MMNWSARYRWARISSLRILVPASGMTGNRPSPKIAEGMRHAAKGMKLGGLRILVENTSGMGSAVGARFEEIKAILARRGTCRWGCAWIRPHTFEAGYDITTQKGLEATLAAVDRTVGLGLVYVLHVNDSKTPLGSRVDAHEHIGRGKIGLAAFGRILNHARPRPRFCRAFRAERLF